MTAATGIWFWRAASDPLSIALLQAEDHGGVAWIRLGLGLVVIGCIPVALLVRRQEIRDWILLPAVLALWWAALDRIFNSLDTDELMHLHSAWLDYDGLTPTIDYWHPWQLLPLLLLRPVFWLSGDNVQVLVLLAKLGMLACLVGGLWLSVQLVEHFGGDRWGALILPLCCPTLMSTTGEFRPDPPATLACLAALYLLVKERPWLAGLAVGLGYACSQKAVFFGFAVGMGGVIAGLPLGTLVRFAGACLLASPFNLLYAAARGIVGDYWYWSHRYAASYVDTSHGNELAWTQTHTAWMFGHELTNNPLFYLWALLGLGYLLGVRQNLYLPGAVATMFWYTIHFRVGYGYYCMYLFWLLALLGAVAVGRLRQSDPDLGRRAVVVCLLLLSATHLLAWAAEPPTGLTDLLGASRSSLARVGPDQFYYGEETGGKFAHPVFRRDSSYFPYCQSVTSNVLGERRAGPYPPMEPPLPDRPPTVMVIPDSRAEELLAPLRGAGLEYERQANMWVSRPTRKERSQP